MNETQKIICTEIWNSNYCALISYCKNILKIDDDTIDEILSDAFLILCKRLQTDSVPEDIEHFLYSTVKNLSLQKIRNSLKQRKNTYPLTSTDSISLDIWNTEKQLHQEIETEELYKEVQKKLEENLSIEERQLFKCIISEQKSYKEISKIIGCTPNAVKQRKYRLLKKISRIKNDILKNI